MIALTPRQVAAVRRAKPTNALALFWPCGSGKSIAALACCRRGWRAWRILIACRANNVLTWQDEGEKFGHPIHPLRDWTNQSVSPAHSVAVSHDMFTQHWQTILRSWGPWDALIVDEAYAVQNPHAARSTALFNVARSIRHTIILNALPFVDQGYVSIFGQYKVLDCGDTFGTSLTQFRETYQHENPNGFGWCDNPRRLNQLTRRASRRADFMATSECDLPAAWDKTFVVDWHPKQKEVYDTLRDNWRAAYQGKEIDTQFAIVKATKLHQICGGTFSASGERLPIPCNKLQVLEDVLSQLRGQRVVVWCAYNAEVEALRLALHRPYRKVVAYHAAYDPAVLRSPWQMLIAQERCGVGLNDLTDISHVVYYSKYWSYYYYMQSRGRTARLNSKHKTCFYFSLVIKGSIDSLVEKNLKQKCSNAEEFAALGKAHLQSHD